MNTDYRRLFNCHADGLFVLAGDGSIVEANPSGLVLLNASSPENLSRASFAELLRSAHRAAFHDCLAAALAGTPGKLDCLMAAEVQPPRWLRIRFSPLSDGSGRITSACLHATDVTSEVEQQQRRVDLETILSDTRELASIGLFRHDFDTGQIYGTGQLSQQFTLGSPVRTQIDFGVFIARVHPDDRDRVREYLINTFGSHASTFSLEYRVIQEAAPPRTIQACGRITRAPDGRALMASGVTVDVTERRWADAERQSHVRFLESLDRINRSLQGTGDLKQMLRDVLDCVLDVFGCDRAWLLYPCDPDAPEFVVPMERYRPEFPGISADGSRLEASAGLRGLLSALLTSHGPMTVGLATEPRLPPAIVEQFNIRSQVAMAVRPKGDRPYVFGVHHCAADHVWEPRELRLFQEIGRRIEDALTSLLMLRNLLESERQLDEAQRLAHVGHWERDLVRRRVKLSAEACRIFGIPTFQGPIELSDWEARWAGLIHPEDRERSVAALADAQETGASCSFEYRIIRPDKALRYVATYAEATRDAAGKVHRLFGTTQDITERKRTLEQLRASEERFRELAETIEEVFWVIDPSTRQVLYLSPGYEKIWGHPRQLLFADPSSLIQSVHPDDRASVPLALAARAVDGPYDYEFRILRPDGEVRWIRDRAFPVMDRHGKVERIVGIARDITERRQLEEQLQQTRKMEAIGTLAGGIAHDFNNILGAILGNAQLAMLDADPSQPVWECLAEIQTAGRRAKSLIEQILTFSRQHPPERRPIALETVVDETLRLLRASLPANVEVTTSFEPSTPMVRADFTQIQQVLLNLCTNAWQALDGRTGRIDIGLRPTTLTGAETGALTGVQPGPYACLRVADTGSGMDDVTLKRIFEPFFTTKAVGKGTGLGLSVVLGIVQNHEGAIEVVSEPGRGSQFNLYFPALADPTATSSDAAPPELPKGRGQQILYVDDEEALVRIGSRMLKCLGYEATACADPGEALRLFDRDPSAFELLITDFSMPPMSGIELAAEILKRAPGFPIILSSGLITDGVKEEATRVGIREVVFKPNSLQELAQVIARLLPPENERR